jgi:hypothetical protein
MSIKTLDEAVWLENPYTWRNNRGTARTIDGRFIRFGIPEPTTRETSENLKGGDRIGFTEVKITADMVGKTIAVFTSIEEKTVNDRLKNGQIKWHNFVIQHGGISEIWHEKKDGGIEINNEITEEIK